MFNHITNYRLSNHSYFSPVKPTRFDPEIAKHKIIHEKKGLCIELNYTYKTFLHEIGFNNSYFVNCLKPNTLTGGYYNIFHNGLIINLHQHYYYVDVGFGMHFVEPHLMDPTEYQGYDYIIKTKTNRQVLRIIDKLITHEEINENYKQYINYSQKDFPFCNSLHERIFDQRLGIYTNQI